MSTCARAASAGSSRGPPRVVFISATHLSRFYKCVPASVMANSVFFFGSDRRWVFPASQADICESQKQPTHYMGFAEEFRQLILAKEQDGLVYWLKPDRNYAAASDFFERISGPAPSYRIPPADGMHADPTTGEKYRPLRLDPEWWEQRKASDSRFGVSGGAVVENFVGGEHDYDCVMELLWQSNPSLVPCVTNGTVKTR
eukprot:m51a1_g4211 hypothetical protein (200) ;mRNA; r:67248-67904